jgi:hypothetical protein
MVTRPRTRAALITAALLLPACQTEQQATTPPAVNTGLNAMLNQQGDTAPLVAAAPKTEPPPTPIEKLDSAQPVDLTSILDHSDPVGDSNFPPKPPSATTDAGTSEAAQPISEPAPPPAPADNPPTPTIIDNPGPPKTLEQKIDAASLVLIDLLRQDSATSTTPFKSAMSLAALEAIRPGSAPKVITPDSTDGGPLTEEQRGIVNAFRDLVSGMTLVSEDEHSKPDAMTEWVVGLADDFIRARPMRINAALAAKVAGYGQYMLMGEKFQQGKPIRAVIYTEVRRFQQRRLREEDSTKLAAAGGGADKSARWVVELTQELQLIHDVDGVKAWQRLEQPVLEASRNMRHDFYLVENISLPPTLSIGAYQLKVIVRDRTSGQQDEVNIPIEVVADPALVDSGTRIYD